MGFTTIIAWIKIMKKKKTFNLMHKKFLRKTKIVYQMKKIKTIVSPLP